MNIGGADNKITFEKVDDDAGGRRPEQHRHLSRTAIRRSTTSGSGNDVKKG